MLCIVVGDVADAHVSVLVTIRTIAAVAQVRTLNEGIVDRGAQSNETCGIKAAIRGIEKRLQTRHLLLRCGAVVDNHEVYDLAGIVVCATTIIIPRGVGSGGGTVATLALLVDDVLVGVGVACAEQVDEFAEEIVSLCRGLVLRKGEYSLINGPCVAW